MGSEGSDCVRSVAPGLDVAGAAAGVTTGGETDGGVGIATGAAGRGGETLAAAETAATGAATGSGAAMAVGTAVDAGIAAWAMTATGDGAAGAAIGATIGAAIGAAGATGTGDRRRVCTTGAAVSLWAGCGRVSRAGGCISGAGRGSGPRGAGRSRKKSTLRLGARAAAPPALSDDKRPRSALPLPLDRGAMPSLLSRAGRLGSGRSRSACGPMGRGSRRTSVLWPERATA